MKTTLIFTLFSLFFISLNAQEVRIDNEGKVAIGKTTSANYPLDIDDKEDTGRAINVVGKSTGINVLMDGSGSTISTYGVNAGVIGGTGASTGVLGSVSDLQTGMIGYGIFGLNTNFTNQGTGYGVFGRSTGSLINYGVYGEASGGNTNWAGYFKGNGYFSDRLGIGTSLVDYPLSVKMNQSLFSDALIHAEVDGSEQVDDIAVKGKSRPADSYGIGGQFEGGKIGVEGISNSISDKIYTGVYGKSSGGMGTNYGLRGLANGGGTNLGVYGEASGGLNNWAGYFRGDVFLEDNLGIGTSQVDYPLTVRKDAADFNQYLICAEVLGTNGAGKYAVYGQNNLQPGIGIGGKFAGGRIGIWGSADNSSVTSFSYGVYATALNGEGYNYGSYGVSSGSGVNYGSYAEAFGTGLSYAIYASAEGSGINYGVYSKAMSGTQNWAGYFDGKTFVDTLNIGEGKLRLQATTDASLSSDGVLMIGNKSGGNIIVDGNELMARNNGSPSPLYLNNEGGFVAINNLTSSAPKTNLHIRHDDPGFGVGSVQDGIGLRIENFSLTEHWTINTESTGHLRLFDTDGTEVGKFSPVSGTYTSVSDARSKTNLRDVSSILNKILLLRPQQYSFVKDTGSKDYLGFLAQEVESIFPQLTTYNKDLDKYHMDYDGFGVIAIKGIQELHEENQKLKDEMEALKEEKKSFEKRLRKLEAILENK